MSSWAIDSPQKKAWLYRLTNVDMTRAQHFRLKDNAHLLHVSFYLAAW